jgi:hypothetical protein
MDVVCPKAQTVHVASTSPNDPSIHTTISTLHLCAQPFPMYVQQPVQESFPQRSSPLRRDGGMTTPQDGANRRRNRRDRDNHTNGINQHTNNHQGLAAPPPADDGSWLAMRPHGARQGIFVRVPFGAVYSMPPGVTKWTFPSDIILCPAFKPADASSCPLGQRCAFVHADPMLVVPHTIHVNYAWRSLDDVTYERNAPGALLVVSSPNSSGPGDVMDSGMTLRTKALSSRRRPLSHCAHYYFNRTCNLGAECRFVHAVFIDLQAKEHQRTPAPVQLGRAAAAAGTLPPTPQQQPLHQPLSHRNHEFPPEYDGSPTPATTVPFRQHQPYGAQPVSGKSASSSSSSSRVSSVVA